MTAAGEGNDLHAGGVGGLDTSGAVFDHQAAFWSYAHMAGGVEEQVGSRFAAFDQGGCEAVLFWDEAREVGAGKAEVDALWLGARGEAVWLILVLEALKDVVDAFYGLQVLRKGITCTPTYTLNKLIR